MITQITFRVCDVTPIDTAIEEAKQMAKYYDCLAIFEFNEVIMQISPDCTLTNDEIIDKYNSELHRVKKVCV